MCVVYRIQNMAINNSKAGRVCMCLQLVMAIAKSTEIVKYLGWFRN